MRHGRATGRLPGVLSQWLVCQAFHALGPFHLQSLLLFLLFPSSGILPIVHALSQHCIFFLDRPLMNFSTFVEFHTLCVHPSYNPCVREFMSLLCPRSPLRGGTTCNSSWHTVPTIGILIHVFTSSRLASRALGIVFNTTAVFFRLG